MPQIMEILSQRRTWASIGGTIALVLNLFGIDASFDPNTFTEAIMQVIQAVGGLAAILLPLWSYFKPKKAE